MYDLKQILMRSIDEHASDIHFTVGRPPCYRVDGVLAPIVGERLTPEMLEELLLPLMDERHREEFQKDAGENRMIWSELYYTCVPMLQIMYVE